MSGCRENSPTGFAQVRDYDTFLIYKLFYENTFFLKNLGAFKDFGDFFYGNVRFNKWIQFSNSNRFLLPLKVGSNLTGIINFVGDSANTKEIHTGIYLVDST